MKCNFQNIILLIFNAVSVLLADWLSYCYKGKCRLKGNNEDYQVLFDVIFIKVEKKQIFSIWIDEEKDILIKLYFSKKFKEMKA